jgi:hypothetical protein
VLVLRHRRVLRWTTTRGAGCLLPRWRAWQPETVAHPWLLMRWRTGIACLIDMMLVSSSGSRVSKFEVTVNAMRL